MRPVPANSAPPPIEGVPTSSCAFVGRCTMGPTDQPVHCTSFAELVQAFGAAAPGSELFASVRQFFDNGGHECLVVRVAPDPAAVTAADFVGSPGSRRGLYAIPEDFATALVVVPRDAALSDGERVATLAGASRFCAERRAFLVVDGRRSWEREGRLALTEADVAVLREALDAEHAAVYFPDVRERGTVTGWVGPAGAVAGIMARTDREQGVWRSPAGSHARLFGDPELRVEVSTAMGDHLNELAVNTLRRYNGQTMVWGSRTLAGHTTSPEWKYVPLRRFGLFLQRSLEQGLRWVAYEPNGEALWQRVRAAAETFLHSLFRAGAFPGRAPVEAYFVRCGADTMTTRDAETGMVRLTVGFAPLRPAEFIVLHIGIQSTVRVLARVAAAADALRAGRAVAPAQRRRRTRRGDTVVLLGGAGEVRRTAAEALAARLQRSVYRVDLQAVVSKYIGETEKHLDRLLEEAEGKGQLLFFDEGDALLGQRSGAEREPAGDDAGIAVLLDRIRARDAVAVVGLAPRPVVAAPLRARARCVVVVD